MSTAVRSDDQHTIDVSRTQPVPFFRLVAVELRKLLDTRSGFWLITLTLVMLAAVMGLVLLVLVLADATITAAGISEAMIIPVSLLVPVLAILTVTSEWSQRTHLVTFTLEPRRGRVILAKLVTVMILGTATIAVAVLVGALGNLLYGVVTGNEVVWNLDASQLGWTAGVQVLWFLMAFGLGMLILNTPGAVAVFYFFGLIAPFMIYSVLYAIFDWAQSFLPWIDISLASMPFMMGEQGEIGALEWGQLGVSTLIWVVIPLVFGSLRVLRSEVK